MAPKEKPSCGQRISAVGRFVYNKEHGTFCGRTAKSWFLITTFYLIFFSLLGGFFVGMLSVLLFGIIQESQPHLTGQQSIIRMNPGLGFRPMPDLERTLIKINLSDSSSVKAYVDHITKFYNEYSTTNKSFKPDPPLEYDDNCALDDSKANAAYDPFKKICRMHPDKVWSSNCSVNNSFGYTDGTPCVIIKMNRIFGWLPSINEAYDFNHTLFRCEAENDGDKVTFGGDPEYYPSKIVNGTRYGYFSSALFPYLNQRGYTPPSAAVRFTNIRHNVLVMVQCRLINLHNSVYSKVDREAMTRFELLVIKK